MSRPFIQANTPSNPPTNSLLLNTYQGGLNNISSDTTVHKTEATDILNMVFLKDGLIEKRKGSERYNNFETTKEIVYIDVFRPINEPEQQVYATLTDLYIDGKRVCGLAGKVQGVTINGRYFFVDGEKYRVYEKETGKQTYAVYEIIEEVPVYDRITETSKGGTDVIHTSGTKPYEKDDLIILGDDAKGEIGDPNPSSKISLYTVVSADVTIPYINNNHIDQYRCHFGNWGVVNFKLSHQPTHNVTVKVIPTCPDIRFNTPTSFTFTPDNWNTEQRVEYGDALAENGRERRISFIMQYQALSEDIRYNGRVDIQYTAFVNDDTSSDETWHRRTVHNAQQVDRMPKELKVTPKLIGTYNAETKIRNLGKKDMFTFVGKWETDEANKTKWYVPCAHEIDDVYKGFSVFPKKPKHIAYRKDRLYVSGCKDDPHTVYVSDLTNPYYFPSALGVSLSPNGDKVNGLIEFHDSIIIARSQDVHVLYGNTNRADTGKMFELKRINTHTGVASFESMQVVHNYLFYLGSDGIVYRMHTPKIDVDMLTTNVLSKTIDLYSDPIGFTKEELPTAKSAFTDDDYYLAIGDKMLVYNYRFMGWTLFTGLEAKAMYNNNNHLIWANQNNHIMHFSNNTFLDEGRVYPCFWESKLFDCGAPIKYKYFKYISLVLDSYEEFDSTAKILFEIDYEDVNVEHTFKNAITRWGKALFGQRFASRNLNKSLPVYVGRRGRLVKIKVNSGYFIEIERPTFNEISQLVPHPNTVAFATSTKKHYIFELDEETLIANWVELDMSEVDQPLKLYNVEVEYSLRGRR